MTRWMIVSGVPTALVDEPQALDLIETQLRDHGPPLGVASINLDHVHHFGSQGAWRGSLGRSVEWLNLIDGFPIATRARRLTGRDWPRLAGSDLIGPILDRAEALGSRVGFLGGSEETRQLLLEVLRRDRPGLIVAGAWSPPRQQVTDPREAKKLALEVKSVGVDLLVVGLGKPRQELWIEENARYTGARVLLAFGAVVDFIAQRVARAPQWVTRHGMEWAWRLALEPRRLGRRYLVQGPPAYLEARRAQLAEGGESQEGRSPGGVELVAKSPGDGSFVTGDDLAHMSVIVVTYNSAGDVERLVSSLRDEAHDLALRVIVVDNSSTDDTVAELSKHVDIELIRAGGNLGYSAGINLGAARVRPSEHVLVLNPDLQVRRGCLTALLDRLVRSDAGVVVPLIQDGEGRLFHSLRREPSILRAIGDAAFGSRWSSRSAMLSDIDWAVDHYTFAHPVDWASGAALLIRSGLLESVGPWNENYFLYMEETDFMRRVREMGSEIWFDPAAQVQHEQGGSGSSPELDALMAVNRLRYIEEHRTQGYAVAYRGVIALHHLARVNQPSSRAALRAVTDRARWSSLPGPQRPVSAVNPNCRGSVVIPAHNEAAVIGRTLAALRGLPVGVEVVVVCNGSTDGTAEISRTFQGVTVLETDVASKPHALNLGDATATQWPRLYLDADVEITPAAIDLVFSALNGKGGDFEAARPVARYDTRGASWAVRAYYRARSRISAFDGALWGAGAYAMNASGHARLGEFPAVTADDLFVDHIFPSGAKTVVEEASVVVRTPRDIENLLKILRRGIVAKSQLVGTNSTSQTARSLLSTVRGPVSAVEALIYAAIVTTARLQSKRPAVRSAGWERDASSR